MRRITMSVALVGVMAAFAIGAVGAQARGHHSHHSGHCGETTAFDEAWLTTGLQGDLFEVKGGKIAQRNTTTPAVTALGRRLVADHSESFKESAALAKRLGVEVKREPTKPETWELEQVGGLDGTAFDGAYSHLEVLDHEQDIEDAEEEVEKGSNCEIRKDAKEEIPMLKEHLKLSKAAAGGSA